MGVNYKMRRALTWLLIAAIGQTAVYGFDTGSHFDLTGMVLTENGFDKNAIKVVQVENWLTDYYSSSPTISPSKREELEKLHFDNLFNSEQVKGYWTWLLSNIERETRAAARSDDPAAALVILGIGLHAVQDFYTHSNWVETHPRPPGGAFRTETFFPLANIPIAAPDIFTGKYPSDRTTGPGTGPVPKNSAIHGDYFSGMNHDSPVRPHWDEAYVFAYAASHQLTASMAKWADLARPGFWQTVKRYAVADDQLKKLDLDVIALRNMSMWINGKGADGHWKGNKSGSPAFFTSYSGKWIGSETSIFAKWMREGAVSKALAANLYSDKAPPAVPDLARFSLRHRAIVVRTTLISEVTDPGVVGSTLRKIGGRDLYSRTVIGTNEFWGRTIQSSREAAEPWCEIYFSDETEVPVKISVWDEDNIDAAKDTEMDINKTAGKLALDLSFSVVNGRIEGDISGIFNSPLVAFTSTGEKPDKNRARISAFITQVPLK